MNSSQRVVITGMGIVSCLGNELSHVSEALRTMRSGIRAADEFSAFDFSSRVAAWPSFDINALFDRKQRRFMGLTAAYAYAAAQQAIAQAQLTDDQLRDPRTGLIAGSGSGSTCEQIDAFQVLHARGARRINPYIVPKWMASTVSANLATLLKVRGTSYSITAACATSAHCIGAAFQQIRHGLHDVMLCGGSEEIDAYNFMIFDAMGVLSSRFNDTPAHASRPFDSARDGFVMAAGGGMLVLESLAHAQQRGAQVIAEIVAYGSSSDGGEMVSPNGEGAQRCMQMALQQLHHHDANGKVDYINAHGTSTPVGDNIELRAIETVFGEQRPLISSTKGLTGHSIGAAGVQEFIYSTLMMQNGFISGNANYSTADNDATTSVLPAHSIAHPITTFMSNSFGFGGTNASLIVKRFVD